MATTVSQGRAPEHPPSVHPTVTSLDQGRMKEEQWPSLDAEEKTRQRQSTPPSAKLQTGPNALIDQNQRYDTHNRMTTILVTEVEARIQCILSHGTTVKYLVCFSALRDGLQTMINVPNAPRLHHDVHNTIQAIPTVRRITLLTVDVEITTCPVHIPLGTSTMALKLLSKAALDIDQAFTPLKGRGGAQFIDRLNTHIEEWRSLGCFLLLA